MGQTLSSANPVIVAIFHRPKGSGCAGYYPYIIVGYSALSARVKSGS
jgi:hypothetical protein